MSVVIPLSNLRTNTSPPGDEDIFYHLCSRKQYLCGLCVRWDHTLAALPEVQGLPMWGPSEEEMSKRARELQKEIISTMKEVDSYTGDEAGGLPSDDVDEGLDLELDDFDDDDLDIGLVEHLDALDTRNYDSDSDIFA